MHRRFPVLLLATLTAIAAPTLAGFAGTDLFLPMVGRQAGVYPSNWYTTVWIHNPGAAAATATISFLERNTANPAPPAVDVLVGPGDTEKIENIVESLFGKQAFGALRVTCDAQRLVVTSRVYTRATGAGEKDSLGQDFAGVPASLAIGPGERTQILGAHQTQPSADSDFRFNFGFVETTGHTVTVRVSVYDDNGAFKQSKDFTVREWSQRQAAFADHFPDLSLDNARLEVEVVSGSGKVIAYGSGIANGSQDPTTFEMEYAQGEAKVAHDATLVGDGTEASPLGLADAAVTLAKIATTNAPTPAPASVSALAAATPRVLGTDGASLSWVDAAAGDITAVVAGAGLAGGAASGDAALSVPAGGITSAMLQDGGVGNADLADGSVTTAKLSPAGGASGKVLKHDGAAVSWGDDTFSLPTSKSVNLADNAWGLQVTDIGYGNAIVGSSNHGAGVAGNGGGADAKGILGLSTTGIGVVGSTAGGVGVKGSASSSGTAVWGANSGGGIAGRFDGSVQVNGTLTTSDASPTNLVDLHNTSPGGRAMYAEANGTTIWAKSTSGSSSAKALAGTAATGYGVYGESDTGDGVYGVTSGNASGVHGVAGGGPSLAGEFDGRVDVAASVGDAALKVRNTGLGFGAWLQTYNGPALNTYLEGASSQYMIYGERDSTSQNAAYLKGKVLVSGAFFATTKAFRIDHPLDPEGMYLYHTSVESPDMKNVYDGVVVLDDAGEAWVELPAWMEALNRDFRYQLTPIGAAAPGLFVADEVVSNRFRIGGGAPGLRVSWQLTGIRRDRWAEANRTPVEEAKPADELGTYLEPEAWGIPAERGAGALRRHSDANLLPEPRD